MDRQVDVIVVGAGVAGAGMAYALGKDGRRVLVIEKNTNEPDRFAGELMQPLGYQMLEELGLDDCLEGIDAQRVHGYAIFRGGQSLMLNYSMCLANAVGRSFHHGRFVQQMRKKATSLPSVELKQGMVRSLEIERGVVKGANYKTNIGDERTIMAPLTIVCDGSFSSLRGLLSLPKPMAFKINTAARVASLLWGEVSEESLQMFYDNLRCSRTLQHALITMMSGVGLSHFVMLPALLGTSILIICRLLLPFPTPQRLVKAAMVIWVGLATILIPTILEGGMW